MNRPWEGLFLVDKPAGPTSHDVIARVRRAIGQRRVGHAGTLDPMASGLLPVLLGTTTRLVRFLSATPKRYSGLFQFGLTTTTDDTSGEVTATHPGPLPPPAAVLAEAQALVGKQLQDPPAFSAKKIDGQRMYALARKGVAVETARRAAEVEVFRFEIEPTAEPQAFRFVAEVSGGTYIRSLARDLGRSLGCGGVLAELRRSGVGPMSVDDSVELRAIEDADAADLRQYLVPPEAIPLTPPPLTLEDLEAGRRFRLGTPLPDPLETLEDGFCRVLDPGGRLLGVAEKRDGLVRPRVVLRNE